MYPPRMYICMALDLSSVHLIYLSPEDWLRFMNWFIELSISMMESQTRLLEPQSCWRCFTNLNDKVVAFFFSFCYFGIFTHVSLFFFLFQVSDERIPAQDFYNSYI